MTISAFSNTPSRPAGALYIQSGSPNGMVFNATEDGPITFCVNNEPVARIDSREGFVVLTGYFGLRRVSSAEMMVMTNMEPGYQVFNMDQQTIFTYTKKGWGWSRMHKFHYHKPNKLENQ
jgi:hypothetical protein